jgi:DNA-directed RNA polymerase subunit RPC12/RpoP
MNPWDREGDADENIRARAVVGPSVTCSAHTYVCLHCGERLRALHTHTWDVACRSGAVVTFSDGVSKTIHTTIYRCRGCGVEKGETE